MTTEEPKPDVTTMGSASNPTIDTKDTATSTSVTIPGDPVPVTEGMEEAPAEKKPLHDCIICNPFEACKHTVPLHETIKPLVRGKTGVEDMFLKASEIAEWLHETGMTLKPKKRSKSK